MLSFRKVADKVSVDPSDNDYLDRMGLTHSRIWIRYRARAIKGIKANHKRSWKNDLECRFCDGKILETKEHLEECRRLSWERKNLKEARSTFSKWWRRNWADTALVQQPQQPHGSSTIYP